MDVGSKNFGDKMDRAADRLLEAAGKMDATFAKSAGTLGDGVDRFGQVGQQISGDVAAGLKVATDAIIEAARRSGDETSKGLREQVGALTATMAHIGTEVSAAIDKSRKGIEDGSAGAAVALGEGAIAAAARIAGAAEKMEMTFTSNVRALENGVDRLTGALDGSVDRFGQVGRQISGDVAAGLKVATDAIINTAQRTGVEVSAAIDRSRRSLEDGSACAATALDKGAAVAAARIVGAADALGAGIGTAVAGLESLSAGTNAQTARLDAAGCRIVEASEALGTAGAAVRDAVAPVAQSLQSIEVSLTQVRQAVEAHRELDASVRDSFERLSALARQTNDMFAAHEHRFGQLDDALGQTIGEVTGGVHQISQVMAEAFRAYDHHMAKAIGSLSNAVENFAEQIDDARRAPARG